MAEEGELSKDLRGDINTRFGELRADMARWMGTSDTRFGELRADMNARFRTLTWLIMVWFSFLTLVTVLFKFLRF